MHDPLWVYANESEQRSADKCACAECRPIKQLSSVVPVTRSAGKSLLGKQYNSVDSSSAHALKLTLSQAAVHSRESLAALAGMCAVLLGSQNCIFLHTLANSHTLSLSQSFSLPRVLGCAGRHVRCAAGFPELHLLPLPPLGVAPVPLRQVGLQQPDCDKSHVLRLWQGPALPVVGVMLCPVLLRYCSAANSCSTHDQLPAEARHHALG